MNARERLAQVVEELSACAVEGCGKRRRSPNAVLCEMHYYRVRRTGSLALAPPRVATSRIQRNGYVRLGNSWEHRVIVARRITEGEEVGCHWCLVPLEGRAYDVDHLDGNPANNDPENLVIACHACNSARGQTGPRRFAEGVAARYLMWRFRDFRGAFVADLLDELGDDEGPSDDAFTVRARSSVLPPRAARGMR